ncbi:MAG: M14 family zinc carboxypeptidase [Bacteroidota bacterium]
MSRIYYTLIFILLFLSSMSQGWRKGEMEIHVFIDSPADIQSFRKLGLDFEPASRDGSVIRSYVVPGELQKIEASGLRSRVTIADMNRHFDHFWDNPDVPAGYYTYDQIIAIADSLAANFPSICKKVIWGTSLGGRQLAALKISDNVNVDEPEPEIMFDGGIHGDEVGGSQNVIMFARDLVLGYGTNPTYTDLINNREIWLYLMVNPDGRVSMSRYNNNNIDCNRDNGYMWNGEGQSTGAFSQVETKALRNCILDNQFVVYTNFHSGSEILSYPWSYRADHARDYAHINQLASVYAAASGYPSLTYGQGFTIMYPINGSTKDFQYGSLGNVGWSMEISDDKQPPASQIMTFYNDNKPAMIEMITRCGWGVAGMVVDSVTGNPVSATVWVNSYYPVYTDPVAGDYHKYILPGTYTIKVVANGYRTKTVTGVTVPATGAVTTNFQLVPVSKRYAFKVMSCQIPGNNFDDEGYTAGALGRPDSVPYSLGRYGWIVLDMGDTICDGPGADFTVIQSGTNNKNYTVSGGNIMDGPFTTIGTATGTAGFDLGSVGMTRARYLYIKDNGTGASFGPGVGFNLDAVEMITPPLVANFTAGNTLPCTGQSVSFTDQSSGNIYSWNWAFPGGTPASSTQKNPVIQYNNTGSYNVTLTISNGTITSSKTRTAYINAGVPPQVYLGADTSLCGWSSLTLDAGNPGCSYLWSTGQTSQVIHADTAGTGLGTHSYWVVATRSPGCAASDTIRVTFDDCTGLPEKNIQSSVSVFPNPASISFTLEINGFGGGRWQLFSANGIESGQSGIPGDSYLSTLRVSSFSPGIYLLKVTKGEKYLLKKILVNPN